MAADGDAELCDAFHDFYRGLLELYPTAELLCRRYDRIRFEDPRLAALVRRGVLGAFVSRLRESSSVDAWSFFLC